MASWGRRSRIPVKLAVSVARPHGVPVIVDAAYELPPRENLWYFTRELGADLAIFSGGKGLRGPASTGLIVGRRDLIQACCFNRSYASKPAVAAKIGKEEIAGLYTAVKSLVQQDERELIEIYRRRMCQFESELRGIPGVQLERLEHGAWADQFGVNVIQAAADAELRGFHGLAEQVGNVGGLGLGHRNTPRFRRDEA
jgi:seryl-tRNA(Sec) selenium transferase